MFLAGLLGLAVALCLLGHLGFRDEVAGGVEIFDIAREQYQRQAGTHWYRLDPDATDHLTLRVIRRAFPVIGGGGADIGALEEVFRRGQPTRLATKSLFLTVLLTLFLVFLCQHVNKGKNAFFEDFCGTGPAGRFRSADPAVKRLYPINKSVG